MKKLHILTSGFSSPNQRAFLFPLLCHHQKLQDTGISVEIFDQVQPRIYECDYLALDSKYYSTRWRKETQEVIDDVCKLSEGAGGLIYFDITDSAGFDHANVLPYVTVYAKSQLFIDRSLYLKPLVGYRLYTDYYSREHGIYDIDRSQSAPVKNADLLNKMIVGWNSGLADYSWTGPYRMAAYERLPVKLFLRRLGIDRAPRPSDARQRQTSIRIGTNYQRATVAYQRKSVAELMKHHLQTNKISRKQYIREISQSKVVISPFGLGEITLRDFEVFMSGALLLKPKMDHMETWPNFFEENKTMVSHNWDLTDFRETLETINNNYEDYLDIAHEGQSRYFSYLSGPDSGDFFTNHLNSILNFHDAQRG